MDWLRVVSPRRTLIAFTVALAFSVWFFMGPYAAMEEHGGIVDERFGSDPDDIRRAIEDMGADGREAYRTFLAWDLLLPVLHAAWMTGFITIGARRWKSMPIVVVLPGLAMLFDWIENLAFLALLSTHPDMPYGIAATSMVAMHAKFALYVASVLVMLVIVGWMVVHPVRRGPRRR